MIDSTESEPVESAPFVLDLLVMGVGYFVCRGISPFPA